MQKQKPIIETSLSERADERERSDGQRFMTKVAGALVNLGLVVSAVLTNIYLMLLVDEATTLPDPYGLLFGFLVGIVAIVPAELALIVWRERLAGDAKITSGQRATAVTALFLAGIFSALTTSSFFSYFLPQLFSPNYIAIAPALNVAAIVGSWIVFIMAIVFYSITSRETKQNLSQAKAQQSMFDARISVLKAAAEAIRTDAEATINVMEQGGVFSQDARRLIIASLGMDEERLQALPEPTPTLATSNQQQPQQQPQPQQPTAAPSGDWQPFGRPPVNLVDLAEQQAQQPARPVGFAETKTATEGSQGLLTHDDGEWLTTWVGADAQTYAKPLDLPADVNEAWATVNRRGLVPTGLTRGRFAELHNRGNSTQRDETATSQPEGDMSFEELSTELGIAPTPKRNIDDEDKWQPAVKQIDGTWFVPGTAERRNAAYAFGVRMADVVPGESSVILVDQDKNPHPDHVIAARLSGYDKQLTYKQSGEKRGDDSGNFSQGGD